MSLKELNQTIIALTAKKKELKALEKVLASRTKQLETYDAKKLVIKDYNDIIVTLSCEIEALRSISDKQFTVIEGFESKKSKIEKKIEKLNKEVGDINNQIAQDLDKAAKNIKGLQKKAVKEEEILKSLGDNKVLARDKISELELRFVAKKNSLAAIIKKLSAKNTELKGVLDLISEKKGILSTVTSNISAATDTYNSICKESERIKQVKEIDLERRERGLMRLENIQVKKTQDLAARESEVALKTERFLKQEKLLRRAKRDLEKIHGKTFKHITL